MPAVTHHGPDQITRGAVLKPLPLRRFRLTRYFSIACLIGITVVTVSLIWTDRHHELRSLIEHEGRANANLTRVFANTVWDHYRSFMLNSVGRSREALLADPELAQLRADVLNKMSGLQIAKIKIYNLDGLTVFSTDERQIGEDKSANPGFSEARAGTETSQITYREKFDAFEDVINNRNLIASYIPVRAAPGAPTEGVFEVYSDVTELLQRQSREQWQVSATVLTALVLLYLFLFCVVRKADRIIAHQDRQRDAKEHEVRHQAYHDLLTGLPNRAYFLEQLGQSIALAARHDRTCVLMFLDLDRFKIINDSLGHETGDLLLQTVSTRIERCLRGGELLFRMGGDEFTVILSETSAPEDAALVARRILEAVAQPVSINEHVLNVGVTIGIAVYPGDGDSAEKLLRNSDAAMYSAKESGRGTVTFYHAEMNQRALARLQLEAALRQGLREGEFAIYYQPRLDAATRRVVALEALLRWSHPTRGVVLPHEFIAVLEDTGMMAAVGEWVLRSACTQVCAWQHEGMAPLRVSVNVSSTQFRCPSFVAMVTQVLDDTRVSPALIELELTESVLISHPEQARATIDALKALGIRIALDDFGTGYSSLNYLRHFAVDYLKIDRCFVTEIATNRRDRAVATAIFELAAALNITVVAEGVETEAQANFFSKGCGSELQGFLFCRPLPVDELRLYLAMERTQDDLPPRRSETVVEIQDAAWIAN
jgi:diguanylate cyclase (GGDEF)-like protein